MITAFLITCSSQLIPQTLSLLNKPPKCFPSGWSEKQVPVLRIQGTTEAFVLEDLAKLILTRRQVLSAQISLNQLVRHPQTAIPQQ